MRLSGFNLYVENYPDASCTLVHNTFSGAYVVLENSDLELLRRADRGETLTSIESEAVRDPDLWDPDVAICVESRAAEEREFRTWFERRRSDKEMTVTFGINLACNFDCPYCSQAEVMSGKVMSESTCDRAADWLAKRVADEGIGALLIKFIGGEPLLHPDRVARVARRVRDQLGDGVDFRFSVTTNGYFLTEDVVDNLVAVGLTGARVTLDGDEHTHDVTRVAKNGKAAFHRIFDNVIAASKRIHINVNGNYQDNTIEGFGPLIEALSTAGLPSQSVITFTPALEGLSTNTDVGSGACTFSGTDMRYQAALYDQAMRFGFDPGTELHAIGPCDFHERHGYAIDPDGWILKCPGFLGHAEKWAIGHVESGLTPRYQQLVNLNPQRECGGCAHRPNCGGGCVATQWIQLGYPEGVNCEHDYFETVTRDGVIRSFLIETSDSASDALQQFPSAEPLPARKPRHQLPVLQTSRDREGNLDREPTPIGGQHEEEGHQGSEQVQTDQAPVHSVQRLVR